MSLRLFILLYHPNFYLVAEAVARTSLLETPRDRRVGCLCIAASAGLALGFRNADITAVNLRTVRNGTVGNSKCHTDRRQKCKESRLHGDKDYPKNEGHGIGNDANCIADGFESHHW